MPVTVPTEDGSAEITALSSVGKGGWVRGTVYRDGIAAAIAIDTLESSRFLVICLAKEEGWLAPTMVSGSTIGSTRPELTQPPTFISDLNSSQMAPPGLQRPAWAWIACSGIAARDATDIEVESSIDKMSAKVDSDGFFLALVKAGWGERLRVSIQTQGGQRVTVQP